jgi:hypothetical protein
MDPDRLGQLILYIVDHVRDLGGFTTTTRLAKLLYLIDLEHQRRYGNTMTGLNWVFHNYGPWSFELPDVCSQMGYQLAQEEFVNRRGWRGKLLEVPFQQEFPDGFTYPLQVMINGLLKTWADRETYELLDYVYRTEPMRKATRGEALDFSIVPRGSRYVDLHMDIPDAEVRRLRESLRSYVDEDASELVRVETVYDEVLEKGLRALDEEDTPVQDLAGIMPVVDSKQLRSTLPKEEET